MSSMMSTVVARAAGRVLRPALRLAASRSRGYNFQTRDIARDSMKDFKRNVRALEQVVERAYTQLSGGRARLPTLLKPSDWLFHEQDTRDIPIENSHEDCSNGHVHKVKLDMQGFKPEDVSVTVKKKVVSVKATQKGTNADGSRARRDFKYEFTLPGNSMSDRVRSFFRSDGSLAIETPLQSWQKNPDFGHLRPRVTEIKVDNVAMSSLDGEQLPPSEPQDEPFNPDDPLKAHEPAKTDEPYVADTFAEQEVPAPGDDDFPRDYPKDYFEKVKDTKSKFD